MSAAETRQITYRGCSFRTIMDAKWAAFFSALRIRWKYRPEEFSLGEGIKYTPEFHATYPDGSNHWFAVCDDPLDLSQDDWEALLRFERMMGSSSVTLLDGYPDATMYLSPREWLNSEEDLLEAEDVFPEPPYRVQDHALKDRRYGRALWSYEERVWYGDEYSNIFGGDDIERAVETALRAKVFHR